MSAISEAVHGSMLIAISNRAAEADKRASDAESRAQEAAQRAEHAARVVCMLSREVDALRGRIAALEATRGEQFHPWSRPCSMCGAPAWCLHREPELSEARLGRAIA